MGFRGSVLVGGGSGVQGFRGKCRLGGGSGVQGFRGLGVSVGLGGGIYRGQ